MFKAIIAIEIKLYVSCCGSGDVGMYWFMGEGDIVYFLIVYKLNRLNYMDFFVRREGVVESDGMGEGLGCVL